MFEDEAAYIFLTNQIDVTILLLSPRCSAQPCFEMTAPDPACYCVRINSQRLRKTIGRVEAGIVLELHAAQLQVDSGCAARVPCSLQLQANALVTHPRIARENLEFGLAPGLLFGACQPQFARSFLQSPVWNTYLLR